MAGRKWVDYISRNPNKEAKLVSKDDEEFVVAQIDETVENLQQKMSPKLNREAEPENYQYNK